jgi:hypothetical protein
MNKTIKELGLVFLGLIIWTALLYIGIAFIKAEFNPFIWSEDLRLATLFMEFAYFPFLPIIKVGLDAYFEI